MPQDAKRGEADAASLTGLGPDQVAFLGESSLGIAGREVYVQTLCWPVVAGAWPALSQAAATIRAIRGELPAAGGAQHPWIQEAAPQLSQPLQRDPATVESTLARLISRLPMRVAVSVVEHAVNDRLPSIPLRERSLFTGSLTAYDTYLKQHKKAAVQLVIAPNGDTQRNVLRKAVYKEALASLDDAQRLKWLKLVFWNEPSFPLPYEVAQLVAAATCIRLQDPTRENPIFGAVQACLAPPSRFHGVSRTSGRSSR